MHHEVTEGVELDVPDLLGDAQSVQADPGKRAWAFGDPLRDALETIHADDLTPREALELVYRLKRLADEGDGA